MCKKLYFHLKLGLGLLSMTIGYSFSLLSQTLPDSLPGKATLRQCIQYALDHQPAVRASLLDEEITDRSINEKLADWFPQVNLNFNVQHDPAVPVTIVQGAPIPQGLANNSNVQVTATQTIFNRDVLLASESAADVRLYSKQQTRSTKIDVVVNVTKAYYAVLVTREQIALLNEAILRLEQSSRDAYTKYQGGIVDKTDFMRAQLALNNALADRKQAEELLTARFTGLKDVMGYSPEENLELDYDKSQMGQEIFVDTTQSISYDRRIEIQILQTQKLLQEDNLMYNRLSFVPSLSLYGGYTINFQNSFIDPLYNQSYRSSYVGLQLSFPLFEGGKRLQQIKRAELQLDRFEFDLRGLENSLSTEYSLALASYKSNLNYYKILSDNLQLAQDVYKTIQLQYKAGTKSYLEFITAETDLRTSQVNQTNALYQLLVSKLDVQKALGTISY